MVRRPAGVLVFAAFALVTISKVTSSEIRFALGSPAERRPGCEPSHHVMAVAAWCCPSHFPAAAAPPRAVIGIYPSVAVVDTEMVFFLIYLPLAAPRT